MISMTRQILFAASMLTLVALVSPAAAADDCEGLMEKLEASKAEGEDRLAEKNTAIEACANRFKRDKTVDALVKACAKYEEQAVVKMQAVADCQLAAYRYATEFHALKRDYGK
jgi:hypothetical protein